MFEFQVPQFVTSCKDIRAAIDAVRLLFGRHSIARVEFYADMIVDMMGEVESNSGALNISNAIGFFVRNKYIGVEVGNDIQKIDVAKTYYVCEFDNKPVYIKIYFSSKYDLNNLKGKIHVKADRS